MGQRMVVVMACMTAVVIPVVAAERKTSVVTSGLEYFQGQGALRIDEFLARDRPMPIDERERARVTAALPAQGAIRPDPHDLAKMRLAEEVLAYHGRRGLITFTIIDVAPAFVGLYERAVILVSARALPLVNDEEFAALVAHEIGHEYVWLDYERAVQRRDQARIRELELRCDGIAVLTLRRLGLNAERLVRAVEMLTWYNQQRKLDADWRDYVSLDERRAFIRAVDNLQQGKLQKWLSRRDDASRATKRQSPALTAGVSAKSRPTPWASQAKSVIDAPIRRTITPTPIVTLTSRVRTCTPPHIQTRRTTTRTTATATRIRQRPRIPRTSMLVTAMRRTRICRLRTSGTTSTGRTQTSEPMQQQTSKDDLEAIIAQAESAQGLRHSTSQDDGGNDTDERDPAIQRARVVFGQPIRHPIHVVTPKDYDVIGLPPALRRTASDGEGFRVWRGPKPDEPIYINGQSGIYKRASDRSARGIDDLLLASVLLHEATHETEKGPVGEGAALRLQADWLRSKLGTLKSADEQRWAEHFLTIIETQSRELLKQQGGSAR